MRLKIYKYNKKLVMVVHTSYFGSGGRRIVSLRLAWTKLVRDAVSKTKIKTKVLGI
jgi:hypothetical protein